MIICIMCTSGRGSGGLLYNHPTNWFSEEPEPPGECPQCGSGLGLFTLDHDQPAAVAVAAKTLLAQREEIERLRAERAALLAPVEDVDVEEVFAALSGSAVELIVRRDDDPDAEGPGDDLTILVNGAAPMISVAGSDSFSGVCLQGLETEGQTGAEVHDAQALALARAICRLPALAREVVRLRAALKDGQIAARATPIVNDIAGQRDGAERRAEALAARLAALEPVLSAAAQIMGVQVVGPTTPEEGRDLAVKLWGRVNASLAAAEEARLTLAAEIGDIKGAPSARWTTDGHNWYGARPDGGMDKIERWSSLSGDGTIKHCRGWTDIDRFGFEKDVGRFDFARAAMIAANKALSAEASNDHERSS